MTGRPCFTVVIPCYNMGAFVGEAVESVFAQGCDGIEVVVVDDGSNDGETPEAIDALARRAPIRVIRTPNRGLAGARNAGVANATGELIAFLDADDRFAPGALDAMRREISAHSEAAYVYGHTRTFGARDEIWHRGDYNLFHLFFANEFEPAVMIRETALDRVGGFRTVGPVPGVEDWDLWLRLGAAGYFGRRVDAVTLEYRVRPGSMVAAIKARWEETVAAIRAANADLFSPARLLDVKRAWSPGISVVAPSGSITSEFAERVHSRIRDVEILANDEMPRAAHAMKYEEWDLELFERDLDRIRADELRWPPSRIPDVAEMERAKRHGAPIWWSADPPRDVDELDGPLARVRLFLRRLRASGEREWTAFGAGLFAKRVLARLPQSDRPSAIYDDNPATDFIENIPVIRPCAEEPTTSRVLVLSDLYSARIFTRASALWPALAGRIHALDF